MSNRPFIVIKFWFSYQKFQLESFSLVCPFVFFACFLLLTQYNEARLRRNEHNNEIIIQKIKTFYRRALHTDTQTQVIDYLSKLFFCDSNFAMYISTTAWTKKKRNTKTKFEHFVRLAWTVTKSFSAHRIFFYQFFPLNKHQKNGHWMIQKMKFFSLCFRKKSNQFERQIFKAKLIEFSSFFSSFFKSMKLFLCAKLHCDVLWFKILEYIVIYIHVEKLKKESDRMKNVNIRQKKIELKVRRHMAFDQGVNQC